MREEGWMPRTERSSLGCWRGISSNTLSIGAKKLYKSSGSTSPPEKNETAGLTLNEEDPVHFGYAGVDGLKYA